VIHAASREALASLRERFTPIVGRFSTSAGLSSLAGELYSVADVLLAQPRLRRTLGDPSTSNEGRARLADTLFGGKISASGAEVVGAAVSERWSSPWDLLDAFELLADDALLVAAEQDGSLDEVEDELFRFERVLESDSQLASLLDESVVPAERRIGLLRRLLADKVSPITLTLLEHAVASDRKHGIDRAIEGLLEAAAARRERSIARVISAVQLTDAQQTRLAEVLARIYGRAISVRTSVEPSVRGGLVIRVGDEIIDGTVSAQLAAARAALTT
jgi:F-type H+-transporting ATPase subunit delta